MTKIVINIEYDSVWIENSVVRRYFEILAELNPTKKYDYELKADLSPSIINDLDDYYWGEVTHLLNGEFWWGGEIPRDCPALVRLVEETGGKCVRSGQAVIAEIPDDVEWEIISWDNSREEVHEKHRSWAYDEVEKKVVCYDENAPSRDEQMTQSLTELAEVLKEEEESNDV